MQKLKQKKWNQITINPDIARNYAVPFLILILSVVVGLLYSVLNSEPTVTSNNSVNAEKPE